MQLFNQQGFSLAQRAFGVLCAGFGSTCDSATTRRRGEATSRLGDSVICDCWYSRFAIFDCRLSLVGEALPCPLSTRMNYGQDFNALADDSVNDPVVFPE
jgi:hypothetical protein